MLFLAPELWLQITAFLCIRDLVLLSHTCYYLHSIADAERRKRQDINRLLFKFVADPETFRCLMRDTGCIIVGDFARAFFTGSTPGDILELLFYNVDLVSCLTLWFSFLQREDMVDGCTLSASSMVDEKVCLLLFPENTDP